MCQDNKKMGADNMDEIKKYYDNYYNNRKESIENNYKNYVNYINNLNNKNKNKVVSSCSSDYYNINDNLITFNEASCDNNNEYSSGIFTPV